MNVWLRSIYKLVLWISILSFYPSIVSAQGVDDFVINDFSVQMNLSNQDPQGFLEIRETITVTFLGNNHGILRVIPASYKDMSTNLTIQTIRRDQVNEPYISPKEGENVVIRIGDPDRTITGQHTYEVIYTMENVISSEESHDEFYWDINGDQWAQPAERVSATLFYSAQPDTSKPATCYTGMYGEQNQDCDIVQTSTAFTATTNRTLQDGETLTMLQAYTKGYFTPPSWWEMHWKDVALIPICILQLLVAIRSYNIWRRFGKDRPKRGVVAPFFGRPKGVDVLQSCYVLENNVTARHVSAAMVDLAIRGHIKITETGSGRSVRHSVTLQRVTQQSVSEAETTLLHALFDPYEVGTIVELEKKSHSLYKTIDVLKNQLDVSTSGKGFYELSPKKAPSTQTSSLLLSGALMIIGCIFSYAWKNPISAISGVIMFSIVVWLLLLMTKRSQKGDVLVEHMKGLKMYLSFSEKERLKAHDAVEAPLTPNATEPVRDRTFFEDLLPYAIALGVEKTWAKAFSHIYEQPPEWYSGTMTNFTALSLADSISRTTSATAKTFSAPTSSGSSGYSGGGGFSGGGGGGGGGGGW